MKPYILVTIFFMLRTLCFSQCITKSKSSQIDHIILNYFDGSDWTKRTYRPDAPSEVFLLILTVDSFGHINTVHLLSDRKNEDSAFSILNNLTATHFNAWQSLLCKNKTIIVPLILLNENDIPPNRSETSYVYDFLFAFISTVEKGNMILKRTLNLDWGVKRIH